MSPEIIIDPIETRSFYIQMNFGLIVAVYIFFLFEMPTNWIRKKLFYNLKSHEGTLLLSETSIRGKFKKVSIFLC